MFKGLFNRKPKAVPQEGMLPPMTDEQRANALAHLEVLKRDGAPRLTPEELKAHEQVEELREKQKWN